MATLTKEQIFKADDLITEKVSVPEWGGDVIVKTWTAKEKADFEFGYKSEDARRGKRQLREIVVSLVLVDEKGELLFNESDIEKLSKKSGGALDRLFEVASKLNHIMAADEEALVKNSKQTED